MDMHPSARPTLTRARDTARRAVACGLCASLALASLPVAAVAQPGPGGAPGAPGAQQQPGSAPGSANTTTYDYTGTLSGAKVANGATVSATGETISATTADQNALLAQNGGTLTVSGATVSKSGDDTNGDSCNFYGINSIGLSVGSGSRLNVSGSSLRATSQGSNGLFATNYGTVYADDDTISTTASNSRGLDATYSGTIVANKMTITTQGDHSAALATDRGGGDVSVTNSTLGTSGSGSPLIYSTGDIEVSGVTGTATGSQIAGMEGLNTILINGSTLTSTNTGRSGSDPVANGVIIYQSTSGDAESATGSTATFQAVNSTLRSSIASGSMFYLTNTSADVVLKNTTLDFDSSAANLVQAKGNDSNNWGSAGSNGASVTLTGIGQTMSGDVVADTISSVDLYLTSSSTWTGATTIETNSAGSTSSAPITVNVDGTSIWVVSRSCTVSNLVVASGGKVVDASGRTVNVVAGGSTVVSGSSDLTVTVAGSYSTSYSGSGAGTLATSLIDRSGFDSLYGTSTTFSLGDATDASAVTDAVTMYRLYNQWSGEHLFTADENEYRTLSGIGWTPEGTAWTAPTTGDAVYRLYNPYSGDHFYTKDASEYSALAALGWNQEGVAFHSASSAQGTPIYRLFNRWLTAGTHLFTTDGTEYAYLGSIGWSPEGVAFYGVSE